ncbi:MAG: hypothetical protein MUO72_10205 [Bacteroidales bacterium]|nr:hypothetical protein [Bacteroidales bacterium]
MNTTVSDHKIDKPLGPSGVFAGYSLIIFGIIGLYFSLTGFILVLSGSFLHLHMTGL